MVKGGGGWRKIDKKEGWDSNGGAPCLALLGGTHSWRGATGDCYCGGDNTNGKGGSTNKKLADLANVRQKETKEDQDDADERGG